MSEPAINVLYIAGCRHSGSTLLNRVLGAHSQIVNVGSLKKLTAVLKNGEPCACGASDLFQCAFWGRVHEELVRAGSGLDVVDVGASSSRRFEADNLALYRAIQAVSGAGVIVDSSRRSRRLERLREIDGLKVIPCHLYKQPRTQVSSWKRKGRSALSACMGYRRRNEQILRACKDDPCTLMLSYEAFCESPADMLAWLLDEVGLAEEPAMLERWGEQRLHSLGGNRMKFGRASRIVLDESWRERLAGWEIKLADGLGGGVWRRMEQRRAGQGSRRERGEALAAPPG